jgi:hypothetical protein
MNSRSPISDVVMDFDGTCTQVPKIWKDYLVLYRKGMCEAGFDVTYGDWADAQQTVRRHSPKAGWTVAGCPAAPAAADPYILADESARLILRRRTDHRTVPPTVNEHAYTTVPAPWRKEAKEVFSRFLERGVRIHFVSNSSTMIIEQRLNELLGDSSPMRSKITVQSDAGKFRICELNWDDAVALPLAATSQFASVPIAWTGDYRRTERPIYLRRGAYFDAIYRALGGNLDLLPTTVFCGDIWEMDLAMPHALGAYVHLVDRAPPFETYDYERRAVEEYGARARASADLTGLLAWL